MCANNINNDCCDIVKLYHVCDNIFHRFHSFKRKTAQNESEPSLSASKQNTSAFYGKYFVIVIGLGSR